MGVCNKTQAANRPAVTGLIIPRALRWHAIPIKHVEILIERDSS